jgi:DNA-3-methyladenine glycosylase
MRDNEEASHWRRYTEMDRSILKDTERLTRLSREFYNRNTLLVARDLLGKLLVHRLPQGGIICGRIVDTEAYAGLHDPASHTYHKKQKTDRTRIWYGEGGHAYVYTIYGSYVCLGIITEPPGTPGAVLIRALELVDGYNLLPTQNGEHNEKDGILAQRCSGPSKLCIAMQIDKRCNELDLCGDELYLEDPGDRFAIEEIVFSPRINIDYAGAGALSTWRYYLRHSPAITKKDTNPSDSGARKAILVKASLRHWISLHKGRSSPR